MNTNYTEYNGMYSNILIIDIDKILLLLEKQFTNIIPPLELGLYRFGYRYNLMYNKQLYIEDTGELLTIDNIPYGRETTILDINSNVIIPKSIIVSNNISNKPFHSTFFIKIVEDIFHKIVYDSNPNRVLLFKDPLGMSNHIKYAIETVHLPYIEDILLKYIPNMCSNDIRVTLNKLNNNFIRPLYSFIAGHESHVYDIDTSSDIIKITRGDDIRAIRYDNAIKQNEINKEIEFERKGGSFYHDGYT